MPPHCRTASFVERAQRFGAPLAPANGAREAGYDAAIAASRGEKVVA